MVRTDENVSKLLDASNADIEHLRKNVKIKLEELFHYKGNLRDKYNPSSYSYDDDDEKSKLDYCIVDHIHYYLKTIFTNFLK